MDPDESKYNPETPVSTPDSTSLAHNEPKAPKDRACPFCGQTFTSSSLGRHLDLYIKPKNPKPPDGLHDVDEIRKIRGGITRRQPRKSVKSESNKKSDDGKTSAAGQSSSTRKRQETVQRSDLGSPPKSPMDMNDGKMHTWFNAANWQATGVINDLPARAQSRTLDNTPSGQTQPAQTMRHDIPGNRIQRPEYAAEDLYRLQESAEIGRAAEMALREVLGSLEAAKRRVEPRALFDDFEFCSLTFPGLCLAMLPPPPTLFTSTPFSAAHTWSLSPPGEKQQAALVRLLHERVATIRGGMPDNVPDSVLFKHRVHLDAAYEHWQTLSDSEQSEAWHLEVCRAFVQEREKQQHSKEDLHIAEQRIRHLEAEYDRLSRCQLPREYLLHPPNTIPVPPSIMQELKPASFRSGASEVGYDAEALLNKWRAEVKTVTRPPRPSSTQPYYVETSRNQMKGDILLNGSVFGVNGPMPRDAEGLSHDPREAYEASRNLSGTIRSDNDANVEEVNADAEINGDERRTNDDHANQRALTRRRSARHIYHDSPTDGPLNAHGKRPFAPISASGRNSGPKIYKEQPK